MSRNAITTPATTKSISCPNTAEIGNASRGMYTLVTRFELDTRLFVPKRSDATKKAHGADLIITESMSESESGVPDTREKAYRTRIPAQTITSGIRIAHRRPMTDCL